MNRTLEIQRIERRIRSSKVYQDWVRRNRTEMCLRCDSQKDLQCHHVTSLYHIILGTWNLFGDTEEVFEYVIDLHKDDRVECVTLCGNCHGKPHPGRKAVFRKGDIRTAEWAAIPRKFWFKIAHSTKEMTPDTLGLVGLQALFGIGWYITNGQMSDRMIHFNRRRFADLLGKTPGTSFNRSLDVALNSLTHLDVVVGIHRVGNEMELHLSQAYIDRMAENPWFLSLPEVQTDSMCTLMLRWFLGHQCRRKFYRISLPKLQNNLGIRTDRPSMVLKRIRRACKDIEWTDFTLDGDMCHFELKRRSSTPIFRLREMVMDDLAQ